MRSRVERARRTAAVVAVALVTAVGCRDTSDTRPVVEVFGPVVGNAGAQLAAALRGAGEASSVELRYIGVTSFNQQLEDRLQQGDRPSVALLPQPGLLDDLLERGIAQPLPDDVVAAVRDDHPDDLVELVQREGRPAAVWLNVDVKSLVWYRPAEFEARGLRPPRTLDELGELVEDVRARQDGVAPWCLTIEAGASTGWVGTDWVEDYVLRRLGGDGYGRWVAGELAFDSPELRGVFEELDVVLRRPGATAGGARAVLTVPWERAADLLVEEPARCLMAHQADFLRRDLPDDIEIGPEGAVDLFLVPGEAPGPPPVVVGGTLAVPLAGGAAVDAAMAVLAGRDLAERLERTGQFLSPHLGVDQGLATTGLRARLVDVLSASSEVVFDGSDLMPPSVGSGTFWRGMRSFFAGEELDAVLAEIQSGWPDQPTKG